MKTTERLFEAANAKRRKVMAEFVRGRIDFPVLFAGLIIHVAHSLYLAITYGRVIVQTPEAGLLAMVFMGLANGLTHQLVFTTFYYRWNDPARGRLKTGLSALVYASVFTALWLFLRHYFAPTPAVLHVPLFLQDTCLFIALNLAAYAMTAVTSVPRTAYLDRLAKEYKTEIDELG